MRVWKREGSLRGRVEKRMGRWTFRHGTCTVKSSPALPSSLAQAGTHKTQHTTSSSTAQLLSVQGARKSQQTTSFSPQSLNNQQFLTAPGTGSRFNSPLCRRPTGWVPTNHNSQPLVYVAAHTQYWYFFWSCAKDIKVKQFTQHRIFFLVQFTGISSALALQDPNIPFTH